MNTQLQPLWLPRQNVVIPVNIVMDKVVEQSQFSLFSQNAAMKCVSMNGKDPSQSDNVLSHSSRQKARKTHILNKRKQLGLKYN